MLLTKYLHMDVFENGEIYYDDYQSCRGYKGQRLSE